MPDPLGDLSYTWPFYAAALFGYLLGSIPFGLVLTKLAGLGDIRKVGSGNIGATNVLRTGSRKLAAATLLLDGAKGAVALLIAGIWGPDMAVLAAAGAMLGHCFPIWLKFNGGKGVATALGILIAIAWPVGLLACATWLAVAALFRYSSLAALAALALAPLYAWYLADPQRMQLALFIAFLVWLRHRSNIVRLLRGQESRISLGKKK
ncbi:MAG: glycerol-3-phosphate 1-O-acyltransferase PlsY [Oceanibaculum sp.]|uniref:Glycerol-3-phosphate acyltransferase n=1 Tax=Oceanibaculum indicum TaxID=526216 RepID=A0A420WSJ8_9PROT|nr:MULTISPECIES: glycerol-3-phosphate 1-O-acyltransferase PlsY [Oceanibaculum]MCH2396022.1 glycerol-3-phosphate 1-O-acyltransferase PlsY [Oceanibaculum sp.]RKQ73792.1 glycerol-3-phosphate acyltransferase PlsY [Oceanibaculum indicum]